MELWLCYLPIQVPLVQVDDLSLAVGHRKLGTAVLFISVLERPLPVAEELVGWNSRVNVHKKPHEWSGNPHYFSNLIFSCLDDGQCFGYLFDLHRSWLNPHPGWHQWRNL